MEYANVIMRKSVKRRRGFINRVICCFVVLFCLTGISYAALIPSAEVTVFGTVFNQYVPENTIDDDLGTFWHGTNDIQQGQSNYLSYRFNSPYAISLISFYENYQNSYLMGELDIQESSNSTDGMNGIWVNVEHIAGDFNPPSGDFATAVSIESTQWIRLLMTYQCRGAHGGSPAFYLSEIDFQGKAVTSPVPEPATLSLLGLGMFGFAMWKKR
jgi:hypothetical protein